MMNADQLLIKLERCYVLADLMLPLLEDDPKAQVIAEIIMETSLRP